jgi:molybdopterin-guanine dinucleotide biosynthesis protein A
MTILKGAIILAGGKSSRMGLNKALIEISGKPMITYLAEKLIGIVDEITVVISKRDQKSTYSKILPSYVKITQDIIEGQNPTIGILSGLTTLRSDYVLVLPCDTPFIIKEVVIYLFDRAIGYDATIPIWPNNHVEPLRAVYRLKSTKKAADAILKVSTNGRVIDFLKYLKKVKYIQIDEIKIFDRDLLTFLNINTMQDLHRIKKILKKIDKKE